MEDTSSYLAVSSVAVPMSTTTGVVRANCTQPAGSTVTPVTWPTKEAGSVEATWRPGESLAESTVPGAPGVCGTVNNRRPGGRVAVIIVGVALAGGGLALAYSAARSKFLKKLNTGEMSPRTRTVVTWLGRLGGVARGAIFVVAGIFLILAAAEAKPNQAKGLDTALRALTQTPLGPWLLLVVAIGWIMFGAFSCCEARWRRVQPHDASPGSSASGPSPSHSSPARVIP